MSKFVRIEDKIAVEIFSPPDGCTLDDCFHPEVAVLFTPCPDTVTVGSTVDSAGHWTIAEPLPLDAITQTVSSPPVVGPNEFYFLWTILEQVAIDSLRATDKVIELFMRRLDDPRTTEVVLVSPAVQAAVNHTVEALVAQGVVKESDKDARIAAILAGTEPQ